MILIFELDSQSSSFCLRVLDSNSSFKAHNSSSKLRSISSNIIHHLEGRSELRGALTCEIGFLS